MGWAIGFDEHWQRDIGYSVPAVCDHPSCDKRIDRGLAYVCANQEPRDEYTLRESDYWPWDSDWWKPSLDPVRNLVKAGALIAAEIDRLQRMVK